MYLVFIVIVTFSINGNLIFRFQLFIFSVILPVQLIVTDTQCDKILSPFGLMVVFVLEVLRF